MKYTSEPGVDINNQDELRKAYDNKALSSVIVPQEPEMKTVLEAVEQIANNTLLAKHRIRVEQKWVLTTIVAVYLQTLIEGLSAQKDRAINGEQVYMNFLDLLEFSLSYLSIEDGEKDGNLQLKVAPGIAAKLAVKDDGTTEDE